MPFMAGNGPAAEGDSSPPHGSDAPRFVLDGRRLRLERLAPPLRGPVVVDLAPEARSRIEAGFRAVQRAAQGETPVYGVNTGFGPLCTTRIDRDDLHALQRNLLLSHAVGVGDPVPRPVVRLMMLLKAHALAPGASGVAPRTVEHLLRLLSADALPLVPQQGSLGASGDLAPLAHLVLPLIGEGTIWYEGRYRTAEEVLSRLGLEPLVLGPKEGLALINGTQFMTAYAVEILLRARRLVRLADVIASMSLEGMMGSLRPFDARLHELRPHRGAVETAENVRRLMARSEILPAHADCGRVQDPYSLRCVPQVHGAVRDALRHAVETVETEINAVTDNPVVLETGEIVSGGLFHGEPLALVLDYCCCALAELAAISERRTYLLLDGKVDLPPLLVPDAGLHNGFMVAHYTAAALVSENKGLCSPAAVDSIPTARGQEDHVSMGAWAAVKCRRVLENAETVLAVELLCAAQALDFRAPLRPGVGPRAAHERVREHVSRAEGDRLFGRDIETALSLLRSGALLEAVEAAVGPLH